MAFVAEQPEDISKWRMVDHERNAILTKGDKTFMGGPDVFYLTLERKVIKFSAYYSSEKRDDGQYKIRWHVVSCTIPDELQDRKHEIKKIIISALDDYGVHYGKKNVFKTEITISPDIGNLNFPELN